MSGIAYEVSDRGYGRWLHLGRRVALRSPGATTRMWPRLVRGTDEHCNRAITLVAWPLGSIDVWWDPQWRTTPCDECKRFARDNGACEQCLSTYCWCDTPDQ